MGGGKEREGRGLVYEYLPPIFLAFQSPQGYGGIPRCGEDHS
jgi:hypothetical protein